MKWVALVGPEIEENLSLRYLASALQRDGLHVELVAFNDGGRLNHVVQQLLSASTPPLLIGISMAFQWRAPDMLALVVALREGGYRGHITLGGHFATFAASDVLRDFPEVDSICRQEAEETLVELARHLRAETDWRALAGLAVHSPGGPQLNPLRHVPDLATLAWPDRRGEPAAAFGHRIAPLVSTRGCYANCTFCCIAAWHEQALPGKRYRERPLEDVADELAALHHDRDIDLFVFHDDNFFLPSGVKNAARISSLARMLKDRGVEKYATVVKARPTDVQPRVFEALKHELHCVRVYVGIETDADQGLATLQRWAQSKHNHAAMAEVERLDLYTCFNILLFDPDTTLASLEDNLAFMDKFAHHPFNFGRTELYAGTPLLHRMQAEGRARGDWLQWDYSMADERIERVFQLTSRAFDERNFGSKSLANTMMGMRFDLEVARHFHPERFDARWLTEAKALSRELGRGSVQAMRAIVARVTGGVPARDDTAFADELTKELRAQDERLGERALEVLTALAAALPEGRPMSAWGDVVATPLQKGLHPEVRP
ncbi:MAG: radical SAM protein [Myxococcaceae bacterium]